METAKSTELERVHAALRTLSAGNRTLIRATDEQQLLRDMCRVIVEVGGYRIACVGYAEHDDQKTIRWMASAGVELETLEAFPLTWADTEAGQTAAGIVIRTGKPSVGRNLHRPDRRSLARGGQGGRLCIGQHVCAVCRRGSARPPQHLCVGAGCL